MSGTRFREPGTGLRAIETLIHTIEPAMNTGQSLFDTGHADVEIVHVRPDEIELLVDRTKVSRHDVVRLSHRQGIGLGMANLPA